VVLRLVITLLCGVGLYTSLFMLKKSRRAERGELTEPSVVQTRQARLFAGLPNSLIGFVYYAALAIGVWIARTPAQLLVLLAAALFAALTSLVLAYSLLFITRKPCPYCWTSHAINWVLIVLITNLFKISYWR